MGLGGYLTLLNASPYDWTLTNAHQYQMSAWSWPQTVSAGTSTAVYVEWGSRGNRRDDAGEAYYTLKGTPDKFTVRASNKDFMDIFVTLDGIESQNNPRGSKIDIGFEHDGHKNFLLSGPAGDYVSSNPPVDWMQQNIGTLGNRKLRHICMPGSHDAGMSTFGKGTAFVTRQNTLTQVLNIYDQLKAGSRYLDIRPVISGGQFFTGHYSEFQDTWLGVNGQSIADIISQINRFTNEYKELVILDLSHAINTDQDYRNFNQGEWNRLFDQLKGLNNRLVNAVTDNTDLTQWPLHNFIGGNKASVLIVADMADGTNPGNYKKDGIFNRPNFPVFNSYADSNNAGDMASDQLRKLKDNRNVVSSGGKDGFFLLSWTLTQQEADVLNPVIWILDFAARAFSPLFYQAFNSISPTSFPNVLFIDLFGLDDNPYNRLDPEAPPRTYTVSRDVAAMAMAVNHIAGKNSFVTG
ncbi:PLC-like phosphodiesterase [Patellaria atrata CBS 101060]|uniref:PLC-like phosphodiesterase n=1 Tax=Patellaria atrata CBS 101060 TaxID=1346257 RepID=A0A9P4S7H4_9PEZI|nr:PLC-like phosphodiesterase [Patellaria atrata CBS 101060]